MQCTDIVCGLYYTPKRTHCVYRLVQGKSECISSIQFVLLQLKTKIVSPNEVSMEVVSSSMDNITSFSQEMLEVFENIGKYWMWSGR